MNDPYAPLTQQDSPVHYPDNITISMVSKHSELKQFHQVPFNIYANDPYWVAPTWMEMKDFFNKKNPYWNHAEATLFIAYKKNEMVGRIAAFIDKLYCKTTDTKTGFFGFFESIEDTNVAHALFTSAQQWLSSKDITLMQGPINGRIDNACGFQCSNFETTPGLLSSYSPAYYCSLAEQHNMKKTRDQIVYYIDLTKHLPSSLKEKAKTCEKSGITLRKFNRARTNKELQWWIDFFLETFQDHWGYIPVSPQEIKKRFGVKQLRWIVNPDLFLIAEHYGEPVGYIWSSPDYNQLFHKVNRKHISIQLIHFLFKKHQINRGIMHFISIQKEYRKKDIGSFLNYHALLEMKKKGYIGAEVGWIDEHNSHAHETIKYTGARAYKTFRLFEKNIEPEKRGGK